MGTTSPVCPSTLVPLFSWNQSSGAIGHKFILLWARAVPFVFLAVSTVTCNGMVLWMFKVKKSLRSCKNIYLGSLALADLLIGSCMFLAIFQQLQGHDDWLPDSWCRLYLILRQSALYVSLLSLVLITGDRWWSIHYPFSYRARRSKRNAFIAVGFVWIFGFSVHVPPVSLWHYSNSDELEGGNYASNAADNATLSISPRTSLCVLPFSQSTIFVSIVSVVQYFIPLMAMLTLNCSLYLGILQRKNIQIRRSVTALDKIGQNDKRTSVASIPDFSFLAEDNARLLNGGGGSKCSGGRGVEGGSNRSGGGTVSRQYQTPVRSTRRNSADVVLLRSRTSTHLYGNSHLRPGGAGGQRSRRFSWAPRNSSIRPIKCGEDLAKTLMVKQDRRAAFWLGLLVLVFLFCWLPHTTVGILLSTQRVQVPQWTQDLTLWVLLLNSAVNPLMYGFFNREIRRAFKQWFCGATAGRKWALKNALAFYGVNLTAALAVPKRVSGFDAVPRRSPFDTVPE